MTSEYSDLLLETRQHYFAKIRGTVTTAFTPSPGLSDLFRSASNTASRRVPERLIRLARTCVNDQANDSQRDITDAAMAFIDGRTDESRYRKTLDALKGKRADAAIRRVDRIYDEAVQLADSQPGDVEAILNFLDRVGDLFDAMMTRVRKLMIELAENAAQSRHRLLQKIADEFVVVFNMIEVFLR